MVIQLFLVIEGSRFYLTSLSLFSHVMDWFHRTVKLLYKLLPICAIIQISLPTTENQTTISVVLKRLVRRCWEDKTLVLSHHLPFSPHILTSYTEVFQRLHCIWWHYHPDTVECVLVYTWVLVFSQLSFVIQIDIYIC